MNDSELRAKIEELEELAPHVPPAVLARRVLAAVSGLLSKYGEVRTKNLEARFGQFEQGAPLRVKLHVPKGETLDTLSARPEPKVEVPAPLPAEILDPGVPASAADRAPDYTSEAAEDLRQFPDEDSEVQTSSATKRCRTCKETKALTEFPENPALESGRTGKCEDCTREEPEPEGEKVCMGCGGKKRPYSEFRKDGRTLDGYSHWCHRHKSQATVGAEARHRSQSLLGKVAVKSPPVEAPPTGERLCASGSRCAAADSNDLVPTPAILDAANPGPLCRKCSRRAGVA